MIEIEEKPEIFSDFVKNHSYYWQHDGNWTFFKLIHELIFRNVSSSKHSQIVSENKEFWKWAGCTLI